MTVNTPEERTYLFEIYTMTQGDTEAQVSMYDVGAALGLEKTDAGTMAEALFIQGFAELKTLSGGIGITRQGLEALDVQMPLEPCDTSMHLGTGVVMEDPAKAAVEKTIQDLKMDMAQTKLAYPHLEEMVMDIKTIEIQMLSPNPKTEIIREVLRSLHNNAMDSGMENPGAKLKALITP